MFEMSTIVFHDDIWWANFKVLDLKHVSGYCFLVLIGKCFVCE